MLPQIGQQNEITNKGPRLSLMQRAENGSTSIWFVQIRLSSQCNKNKSNCPYPSKFIWNATENCIHPLKIPFRDNVCRCRIRVRWNIIVRMSQNLWIKRNQKSSPCSLYQSSSQIFRVKVRIEIYQISLRLDSLRVCRSILMQSSKMNQAQSCLQERKQIVKTIKTIQSRVIHRKSTP